MIKGTILYLLLIILFCSFIYLFFKELKEILLIQNNIFTEHSKKSSILTQKEYKLLLIKYICLFLYLIFIISSTINFLGLIDMFEDSIVIFNNSNNTCLVTLFALIICKYVVEPRFK